MRPEPNLEMLCSPGLMGMDYLSKEAEILPGDEVVTSGLGGVFPSDLLVGHVAKVNFDHSGLYQRAEIMPAAHLGALDRVFVVASRGFWPERMPAGGAP
jgi:rod shape-determining protein MreC